MKYQNLLQIAEFLQKFHKISNIKRVGDNLFYIVFDDYELFFDLGKTHSNIHKNENFTPNKIYKAPFDLILEKRFASAKISAVEVPKNNRILHICATLNGSYKKIISHIYFEFTGRFTNVIITDENNIILEALRHFENEFRNIKVGVRLKFLPGIEIREKTVEKIENFDIFFENEFNNIKNLQFENLRTAKILSVDKKIENFSQNLCELPKEEELLKNAADFKLKGEILIENLYKLKDFDRKISIYKNDKKIEFSFEKPPKISANDFFTASKKLRQKAANLYIQRQNLDEQLKFWQNLKTLILNAKNGQELEILLPKHEITAQKKEKNNQNVQNFYIGEFKISVGKNKIGNEWLLKNSAKNDFWFHIKDIPGAHVIVKTAKQNLTPEIIEMAAKICVNFSVNTPGNFNVDYTKRGFVRVVESAFVNYNNFKTIKILKP